MIRQLVHRAAAAIARATEDVPSARALFGLGGPTSGRWHLAGPPSESLEELLRRYQRKEYSELPPGVKVVDGGYVDEGPHLDTFKDIEVKTTHPMTPAETKRYPHLARAFASERKPVEEAGSPHLVRDEQAELAGAIAARTEPGGPDEQRPPRTKQEITAVLADVRKTVSRQMKQTEQQRREGGPGRPKRDVRRTCPSCQQKSGGPQSKVCFHCHEPFPKNPRKKNVL